jgi:membrane associated rhomboid family serine protease
MSYQEFRPSRFQLLPFVIKNLIIINVIVFIASGVLQNQLGINVTDYLGLHYYKSELFKPHQFISYMFMHGSWMHIIMNMFALWMFGNALENVWGPKRFLFFYLVTGIGAALIYMLYQWYNIHQVEEAVALYSNAPSAIDFSGLLNKYFPLALNDPQIISFINSWSEAGKNEGAYIHESLIFVNDIVGQIKNTPTVGASGSVYGVLVGFGMLFPNTVLYFILLPVPLKAKYVVSAYIVIEVYYAIQNNPGDNVAHLAHLGGVIFAYFLIKIWNKNNREHFY